jgi:hypothetical protein
MILMELFLAILMAVAIGLLFYFAFRVTGPWGTLWTFLLILILVALAAEIWITPVGPVFYDFAWLPTFFVILIFALLISAASPSRSEEVNKSDERVNAEFRVAALSGFFWILILVLVIAVVLGLWI